MVIWSETPEALRCEEVWPRTACPRIPHPWTQGQPSWHSAGGASWRRDKVQSPKPGVPTSLRLKHSRWRTDGCSTTKIVRSDPSSLGGLESSQCWIDSWNQGAEPRSPRREELALWHEHPPGPELDSWVLAHRPSFCAHEKCPKALAWFGVWAFWFRWDTCLWPDDFCGYTEVSWTLLATF